ncbi:MAG: glycolate oxidase subunit GlcD, partial [FCB group bacterium]|nr:glycolate oxidase subunit GlcD [FCB group bacterium]
IFGHAGDGNIHINFIFDKNDTGQSERAEAGVDRLFTKVVELGGSISGEHGIGLAKQKYLPKQLEAGNVAMQKQLKAVFDPQNLLNPGKIFV